MPSLKLKLGIETKENKANKLMQTGTSFFHSVEISTPTEIRQYVNVEG